MAFINYTLSKEGKLGNKEELVITINEPTIDQDTEIITAVRTEAGLDLSDKITVVDEFDNTNRLIKIRNKTDEAVVGEIEILAGEFDAIETTFDFEAASSTTSGDPVDGSQDSSAGGDVDSSTDTSTSTDVDSSPTVGSGGSSDSQTSSPDAEQSQTEQPDSVGGVTPPKEETVVPPTVEQTPPEASQKPPVGDSSIPATPPEPTKPEERPDAQQQPQVQEVPLKDLNISFDNPKLVQEDEGNILVNTYLLGSRGSFTVSLNTPAISGYEVVSSNPNIEVIKYKDVNKFSVAGMAYESAVITINVEGYKPKEFQVTVNRQFIIPLFDEDGNVVNESPNVGELFATRVINLREENLPFRFPFTNAIDQITQAPIVPDVTSTNDIIVPSIEDGHVSIAVSQRLAESTNGLVTVRLGENHLPYTLNVSVIRADWMPSDFVPEEFPFHNGTLSFYAGDKSYIYLPEDVKEKDLEITVVGLEEVEGAEVTFDFNTVLTRLYIGCNMVGNYTITFKHEKWLDSVLNLQVLERPETGDGEEVETSGEVYYDLGECPKVRLEYNEDSLVSAAIEASEIKGERAKLAFILEHSKGKTGAYEKIYTLANGLCTYNKEMSRPDIESEDGANQNAILYSLFMSVLNEEDEYTFKELFRLIVRIFKIYQAEALNELKITRFEESWTLPKSQFDLIGLLGSFFNKYVNTNGAVSVTTLNITDSAKNRIKGYISKGILP